MYQYNYSIVIPYRDTYDLLLKAVKSVPDREDIQIIIVDNSNVPLEESQIPLKRKASVVFCTSSPTRGAGCARNVGLSKAKGRYLLLLDADDYFIDNSFEIFDGYLEKDYDIVYFKTDSIFLLNGEQSNRHIAINSLIDKALQTNDEGLLRYRFVNPISKLIKIDIVKNHGIQFEETPVSNDVWFSVQTGYHAKKIKVDSTAVYMITAGEAGSSLTRRNTKENLYTRYQVMVRVNRFLKTHNKYKYHIRLTGFLRKAWSGYGFKEFLLFLKYACDNRVGVF